MKYIMVDYIWPVIFADAIEHRKEAGGRFVTSAGFVTITDGRAKVHGESLSLGKRPDVDDEDIINLMLGGKL